MEGQDNMEYQEEEMDLTVQNEKSSWSLQTLCSKKTLMWVGLIIVLAALVYFFWFKNRKVGASVDTGSTSSDVIASLRE
jgi:hypothetical protein